MLSSVNKAAIHARVWPSLLRFSDILKKRRGWEGRGGTNNSMGKNLKLKISFQGKSQEMWVLKDSYKEAYLGF